jgi:putative SOS response-associated peptidase YedK
MCGRFLLSTPARELALHFDVEVPELFPRYNIAPTQPIGIVRLAEGQAQREWATVSWGLVPGWAGDADVGSRLINARAETAADKPSFRTAFRRRRCLVPADGFYEWKPAGRHKQPHLIRPRQGGSFAFAGLWECWHGPGGACLETAAILTTTANEAVQPIHDRMPVLLRPQDYVAWLDPLRQHAGELQSLLRPWLAEGTEIAPVGSWVSNPRHEGPRCLEPADVLQS